MEALEMRYVSRFSELDARISRIEEAIQLLKVETTSTKRKLAAQVADNITAVVGVKEMLTGQRLAMKLIWATLLCLGVLATAYFVYAGVKEYYDKPTATNVELRRKPSYEFPHLILCPGSWVDAEKAYAKGLTREALKYAVAYLDGFAVDETINVSRARRTFQDFYHAHNYSSLLKFYLDITVEPVQVSGQEELAKMDDAAYSCDNCVDESPMEKVVIEDKMCYAFKFEPIDAKNVQTSSLVPEVAFQTKNKNRGIIPATSNWFAYLVPDTHVLQPKAPAMAIEQFAVSTLKSTFTSFHTFNNDNSRCLEQKDLPQDYSPERCAVKCLHDHIEKVIGCGIFQYSAYDESDHPSHYCNYFDTLPKMPNVTFRDYQSSSLETNISRSFGAECVLKCSYPCDRQLFTATFDSKYPVVLDSSNATQNARYRNLSYATVNVFHEAISQGGVMTLTEISTYSFTTLISNVGGTLGLFVGGTIMTIFQIILWGIDYCLDRTREKRRPQSQPTVINVLASS